MIPISKLYYQRILILLAFSLLCSCGWFGGDKIQVTSRNFGEEIDLQQNLSFTFNNDLVSDSLLDKWVETEYIQFTPAVKGKYKWASRNVLMFSPTSGFKPSTDYKAELTKKLGEGAEKKISLGDEHEFAFHTPYLRLVSTDVFWAMNQRGVAEVRMNMNFNYKVNPADLVPLTKVQVDKQQAAYTVNTVDVSESVQVAVEQPKGANYNDKPLDIVIAKGLRLPESDYVANEMKFEAGIPSREEFRIVQATGEMDGEEAFIHIYTNQEVGSNEAQIKAALKMTPQVNVRIEKLDAGFIIRGDYQPNENYLVSLSKNLKGIFGGTLTENFEQSVAFADTGLPAPLVEIGILH